MSLVAGTGFRRWLCDLRNTPKDAYFIGIQFLGCCMLTQDRLKQVLSYDPHTGVFTRIAKVSRKTILGSVAGYVDKSHGYVSMSVDGKEYYAHRLAWLYMTGTWPTHTVDHRDRDRANNRFSNLRAATRTQNNQNMSVHDGREMYSAHKGVTWHKAGKRWMAQINANGKHHYLGLFASELDAANAYEKASVRLHGEFATNGL